MTGIDVLVNQIGWCGRNTNYNLDFIPDDKLNWKPGADAKSALEIVHHAVGAIYGLSALINGEAPPEVAPFKDREEAKAALTQAVDTYIGRVKGLSEEKLNSTVSGTPFGDLPMTQILTMPVIDLVHHHGQIAYIQTLLGDNEMHFAGM